MDLEVSIRRQILPYLDGTSSTHWGTASFARCSPQRQQRTRSIPLSQAAVVRVAAARPKSRGGEGSGADTPAERTARAGGKLWSSREADSR